MWGFMLITVKKYIQMSKLDIADTYNALESIRAWVCYNTYISVEATTVCVSTHVDKGCEDCSEADEALFVMVAHTLPVKQEHLEENYL